MMHNPLPKTVRFISSSAVRCVDASRGSRCRTRNLSILPSKIVLVVVGIANGLHRRSRLVLFALVWDVLADRMRRTCRHCVCSISSGTLSTVQRRGSTW